MSTWPSQCGCLSGICTFLFPSQKDEASTVTTVMRKRIAGSLPPRKNAIDMRRLLLCPDPSRAIKHSYKVLGKVGSGGFGSVYSAQMLDSDEVRAIKQVSKSDVQDDMNFIYTELEAMVSVDHPNVAKFYEYFEDASFIYLVTELCDGGDYSDIDRSNLFEVQTLYQDLMLAVAYFHDRGVAHRDLKFENCLIHLQPDHRKVGKVIDFGLAAIKQPGDETGKWLHSQLGTRYFIAPEVVDSQASYGVKCDNWAVGVMLYITLTDEHPCARCANGLDERTFFNCVLRDPIRKEPLEKAKVSEEAKDLIQKLLKKDPTSRITMLQALRHPWLKKISEAVSSWKVTSFRKAELPQSDTDGDLKLSSQLCKFGALSRFEKVILTISAHEALSQEVESLTTKFMELDKTKDGSLTRDEIKAGLEAAGQEMTDSHLDEIFASVDLDGSDKIQYTEWLAATMQPSLVTSEDMIKKVFTFLDLDGKGQINKDELMTVLGQEDLVAEVLAQFDTSHDGMLQLEEFSQVMQKLARRLTEETLAS